MHIHMLNVGGKKTCCTYAESDFKENAIKHNTIDCEVSAKETPNQNGLEETKSYDLNTKSINCNMTCSRKR